MAEDCESLLWTQEVQWPETQKPEAWGISCYKTDVNAGGLCKDPGKIHTGCNSGFAAINHALHLMGGEPGRIILLGYDMQMAGDKRHFFGAHPEGMEVASNYVNFMSRFATINPSDYGLEIWNCTRRTAMRCFPCYDFDEVVAAFG